MIEPSMLEVHVTIDLYFNDFMMESFLNDQKSPEVGL